MAVPTIRLIAVGNGGSGYSIHTAPTVRIGTPSEGGTQAVATAVVGGSSNDDGSFSDPGVIGATSIIGFYINTPGSGYSRHSPPRVTIAPPDRNDRGNAYRTIGSGATAEAKVSSDGSVESINIIKVEPLQPIRITTIDQNLPNDGRTRAWQVTRSDGTVVGTVPTHEGASTFNNGQIIRTFWNWTPPDEAENNYTLRYTVTHGTDQASATINAPVFPRRATIAIVPTNINPPQSNLGIGTIREHLDNIRIIQGRNYFDAVAQKFGATIPIVSTSIDQPQSNSGIGATATDETGLYGRVLVAIGSQINLPIATLHLPDELPIAIRLDKIGTALTQQVEQPQQPLEQIVDYRYDLRKLLTGDFRSKDWINDLAVALSQVFFRYIYNDVQGLLSVRDPTVLQLRSQQALSSGEILEGDRVLSVIRVNPESGGTPSKQLLIDSAHNLGFSYPSDNFSAQGLIRLLDSYNEFISEKSPISFLDYIGYIADTIISAEILWTKDYLDFRPRDEIPMEERPRFLNEDADGNEIALQDGDWYPTPHVTLNYATNPNLSTTEVIQLFQLLAPAHLVVEGVSLPVPSTNITFRFALNPEPLTTGIYRAFPRLTLT